MDDPLDKVLESKLIEQIRNGDQRAFNQIVHHYYNRVFRTAFGVTRNEENAKEVTQQTWIKVWNKIDSFKGESAFTTWLYRITTFTALDFLRITSYNVCYTKLLRHVPSRINECKYPNMTS